MGSTSTSGMLSQHFSSIPYGIDECEDDPVIVNRESAESIDCVYAAIQIYCNFVEMMDCFLWENQEQGNNCRRATEHPAYLLSAKTMNKERPEIVLAGQFRATMMYHALTNHGGYAEIVRDGRNDAKRFVPLDPRRVCWGQINGEWFYVYLVKDHSDTKAQVTYTPRPIKAKNMFHLRGFSDDCLTGKTPMRCCSNDIGLILAMHRNVKRYYVSGGGVKGFFLLPPGMSAELYGSTMEVIKAQMKEMGGSGGFKAAPLFDNIQFQPMTGNAKEMMLDDIMKLAPKSVARMFNLPLHLLADDTKTTHNTISDENERLLRYSLNPWLRRFEGQYDSKLLTDRDWLNDRYQHKFDRRGTFQGSSSEVYEQARENLTSGLKGWGETRMDLEMCTDPDDWFFIPANLVGGVIWNPKKDEFKNIQNGDADIDGDGKPEKDVTPAVEPAKEDDDGEQNLVPEPTQLQDRMLIPLRNMCNETTGRMSRRLVLNLNSVFAKEEKQYQNRVGQEHDHAVFFNQALNGILKEKTVVDKAMGLVADSVIAAGLINEIPVEFNLIKQLSGSLYPLLQSGLKREHFITLARGTLNKFEDKMTTDVTRAVFGAEK